MVSLQRGAQITKSTLSFTVEHQGQQNQTILVQSGLPRAQHGSFEAQTGALGRYVFCTFRNFFQCPLRMRRCRKDLQPRPRASHFQNVALHKATSEEFQHRDHDITQCFTLLSAPPKHDMIRRRSNKSIYIYKGQLPKAEKGEFDALPGMASKWS